MWAYLSGILIRNHSNPALIFIVGFVCEFAYLILFFGSCKVLYFMSRCNYLDIKRNHCFFI